MSLVALALRKCLRRALLDRTPAEDRVFEGLVTPIPQLTENGAKPLIVVATDDDSAKLQNGNKRFSFTDRKLEVVVEIVIAKAVRMEAGALTITIPHTDTGLDIMIDLIAGRVHRAMKEPNNPWADAFQGFCAPGGQFSSRRGAGGEGGSLFAARQMVFEINPIQEPPPGVPIDARTPWGAFLALLRGDPLDEPDGFADLIEVELTGPAQPDWKQWQAQLGATSAAHSALGLATVFDYGETPDEFKRAEIDRDGTLLVVEPEPPPP